MIAYSHPRTQLTFGHILFKNVEVVKKMTIDEKIVFWKKVMQMAADRGIDVYLFTWNIFTYGADGKHGITRQPG